VTPRLSLRGEAQADIRGAARWYDVAEVRRALIRRFPYAIYFFADPEAIVVLACLHVRRDPQVWQSRAGI
jgi:plasmid stabilization system protein ParE